MKERQVMDQRTGKFWLFILKHPKGDEALLIIEPPEGVAAHRHLPVFEARVVRDFLNDADQP